jgi:hypothetical protein
MHKGPRGFTNLVVERKPNGDIILDDNAARALFNVLRTWLRCAQ